MNNKIIILLMMFCVLVMTGGCVQTGIAENITEKNENVTNEETKKEECELISAGWSTTQKTEGETATLSVEGNNCDGMTVTFEVLEDDLAGDDLVGVNPGTVTFFGNMATAMWVAEWQDDAAGDPEYYFNATAGESVITSDNLLTVIQKEAGKSTTKTMPSPSGIPSFEEMAEEAGETYIPPEPTSASAWEYCDGDTECPDGYTSANGMCLLDIDDGDSSSGTDVNSEGEWLSCTDSDGGQDIYEKGTVTVVYSDESENNNGDSNKGYCDPVWNEGTPVGDGEYEAIVGDPRDQSTEYTELTTNSYREKFNPDILAGWDNHAEERGTYVLMTLVYKSGTDFFRVYLPPGAVRVNLGLSRLEQFGKVGAAVRMGIKPQCEYSISADDYYDLPWGYWGGATVASLNEQDYQFRNTGGQAVILSSASVPADHAGQWIYIKVLKYEYNDSPSMESNDDVGSVKFEVTVDTTEYKAWYESFDDWDAGGNPLPLIGSSETEGEVTYTDTSLSDDIVREYYCDGNEVKYKDIECPDDYASVNGMCFLDDDDEEVGGAECSDGYTNCKDAKTDSCTITGYCYEIGKICFLLDKDTDEWIGYDIGIYDNISAPGGVGYYSAKCESEGWGSVELICPNGYMPSYGECVVNSGSASGGTSEYQEFPGSCADFYGLDSCGYGEVCVDGYCVEEGSSEPGDSSDSDTPEPSELSIELGIMEGGRCTYPNPLEFTSCTKDSGRDIYQQGTATATYYAEENGECGTEGDMNYWNSTREDYSKTEDGKQYLYEYFCHDETMWLEKLECPSGTTSSDGACSTSACEPITVDGGTIHTELIGDACCYNEQSCEDAWGIFGWKLCGEIDNFEGCEQVSCGNCDDYSPSGIPTYCSANTCCWTEQSCDYASDLLGYQVCGSTDNQCGGEITCGCDPVDGINTYCDGGKCCWTCQSCYDFDYGGIDTGYIDNQCGGTINCKDC